MVYLCYTKFLGQFYMVGENKGEGQRLLFTSTMRTWLYIYQRKQAIYYICNIKSYITERRNQGEGEVRSSCQLVQ